MSSFADRLSLKDAPPPGAAVEVAADHVSAASLEFRGGRPVIAAHAVETLPPGALVPSLTTHNVRDRAGVASALARVLERVGRPRRIGLIVPDPATKVSLVRFEQVPARAQDLDQLIRWQMKKAAPFPIEEAQVSHVPGLRATDGQEFVVTLARRDIIQEYETLCSDAGAHAGIVDISTFNVINAALAGWGASASDSAGSAAGRSLSNADWLLVNVATDYASIAILRGADLMFFRSRSAETDGTLADLVHQTAMYYEDRLQGVGFSRVMLSGAANAASDQTTDVDQIRRNLESRIGSTVEQVDVRAATALTDRITAAPSLLDTLAALVGLLLRGRGVAV